MKINYDFTILAAGLNSLAIYTFLHYQSSFDPFFLFMSFFSLFMGTINSFYIFITNNKETSFGKTFKAFGAFYSLIVNFLLRISVKILGIKDYPKNYFNNFLNEKTAIIQETSEKIPGFFNGPLFPIFIVLNSLFIFILPIIFGEKAMAFVLGFVLYKFVLELYRQMDKGRTWRDKEIDIDFFRKQVLFKGDKAVIKTLPEAGTFTVVKKNENSVIFQNNLLNKLIEIESEDLLKVEKVDE